MPRQKLTKRADGRYACKCDNKFFYGKTAAEALEKRDLYIHQKMMGLNVSMADVTFEEYSQIWLDTYRSACNPMQKKQYANFITMAGERLNQKFMRDVTATDIKSLYNTLEGYSKSHINKFCSTIRSIFKAAVEDGVIVRNPTALPKPPEGTYGGHRALLDWERELIESTCQEHEFGPAAMVMMYAGLRRGEALYLDVDRDVDFEAKTITVNGAVSFTGGNQGHITDGKTDAAKRTIPLSDVLANALRDRHGLLCRKANGELMSESSFDRKYQSYITFLETKLNGCHKRWYGLTKQHKALIAKGEELPPWQEIDIRCHDFRVTFCTLCYYAGVPLKTLQVWMGHADVKLIMDIYTKLLEQEELKNAQKLINFAPAAARLAVQCQTTQHDSFENKTLIQPNSGQLLLTTV